MDLPLLSPSGRAENALTLTALLLFLLLCLWFLLHRFTAATRNSRTRLPLPPGPKPLPILGNILDMPPRGVPEYQHWLKHKDLYGPVSSVTVMGRTLVLIHDLKATHDILDTNSAKTSGRPQTTFATKLCKFDSILICLGYNDKFRHCRKLLHRELGTKASVVQYQKGQEVQVNRQLARVLREPEKLFEHYRRTSGATVLKMAYGYTVEPHQSDALIDLAEQGVVRFSRSVVPLTWAVDLIPALQHLPENFGGSFKKTARRWSKIVQTAANVPYHFVRRQMDSHTHEPSYVSKLVQQYAVKNEDGMRLTPMDEHAIMWTAATLYGAAADTTVITLTSFTLGMILNPEVQRRAQEEIDRVVGSERLPTFADRPNLPYIEGVVKEASRWWPNVPMGFPHEADEDVEYNGYCIPKGALVIPAIWWFLHDPQTYADPGAYDPARYLAPRNEPDPTGMAFGFGRRICPGRFFADSSLYLNIVQSLAVFNFYKAVGVDGREIEVNPEMMPGILGYPSDFQFRVAPRSEKHVELIRRVERDLDSSNDVGDSGQLERIDPDVLDGGDD